jgi:hypothetical protein
MPHTTHAYPFEAKVGAFAWKVCAQFTTGAKLRAFLLLLDEAGNAQSITFEDGETTWLDHAREAMESGTPYLFFDPLEDGMEYVCLTWHRIERATMERLIEQSFEESDFTPDPQRSRAGILDPANTYPASWGVMF